jgi:chorismate dehydratase
MQRPRIGHIQFLNCLPLYYGLINNNVLFDIELVKGTPMELNQWLIEGKLDIGPISSIEYCRYSDDLWLLPNLSVSCDGAVKSILLVSKLPLSDLDGRKVALANTSATSQALTKIILSEKYKVKPEYFVCPPDLGGMFLEADAALLIGDAALRILVEDIRVRVYDLGLEWKKFTGRRTIFAVWAVRKAYALAQPELTNQVYQSFLNSMRYSIKNVSEIAKAAARWEPFSAEFLEQYFRSLRFDFDKRYQEDLIYFASKAIEHGFLDRLPKLRFVKVGE